MNKQITFAGTLALGHVSYYFEIGEDAYIEKNLADSGRGEFGTFTIEEARKCWKALKAKGFKEIEE